MYVSTLSSAFAGLKRLPITRSPQESGVASLRQAATVNPSDGS
jgi:hypothetical protein